MTLIAYKEQRFAAKSLKLIEKANEIIADFQSQGYTLTLRQLYYQFITINYFSNSEQSYNRLGETISNARLAGLVSWDAIEDKTRFVRGKDHWNGEEGHFDFMRDSKKWFNIDMWENQPNYVEVWIEKDALLGVIERPCWELDVPYMSCRGYMSQSEEWAAANRFSEAADSGRNPVLIYLGDHDPSGIDMSRDHNDRLTMFLEHLGVDVDVRRVALNLDQVQKYKPPENPTKPKDSRSPDYVRKFGRKCWELDALKPSVLDQLVRDRVDDLRDMDLWAEKEDEYKVQKTKLRDTIELGIEAFQEAEEKKRREAEDD
ncbi:hypothetical protein BABAJAGA_00990 [Brevundimonas phage vB_BgoS-BabaJaga]|nr:hypothetical protein BABAJAGA_00990 [Brevundimonas phage vB_BgoS-BabaJaga]